MWITYPNKKWFTYLLQLIENVNKIKTARFKESSCFGCNAWQCPTLPEPCGSSTIGAEGLNGRVRDGYVWFPFAIITKRLTP